MYIWNILPHCICLLRKEQCKKLSSYILPKESRRLSLCVILYFIFFTSHYSVLVLLQILLLEGKKDTTQMSIHFQPSRIHSSFVERINLAESQEVSSRVLIDRSEARISFSSLVETFGPSERQSLRECKVSKKKIHTFGGHFSQNIWKENVITSWCCSNAIKARKESDKKRFLQKAAAPK